MSRARVLRRDCRILGDLQRRVHSPLSLSSMRGALLHSRDGCCAGASWGGAIHLSHFSAPTDRSNTEPLTRGLLPPPSFGGSRMMQQQANRLGQERKGWGVKLSSGAVKDPAQELPSLASCSHRVPARAAFLARPLLLRAIR